MYEVKISILKLIMLLDYLLLVQNMFQIIKKIVLLKQHSNKFLCKIVIALFIIYAVEEKWWLFFVSKN